MLELRGLFLQKKWKVCDPILYTTTWYKQKHKRYVNPQH